MLKSQKSYQQNFRNRILSDDANNTIVDNTANILGNNIGSHSKLIKIVNTKEAILVDTTLYNISEFRSGGSIDFSISLIDEEGGIVNFDPTNLNLYTADTIEELKNFDMRIFSLN